MLRVLFVCQDDFGGPSEKQMLGYAQELIKRGHQVLFSFGGSAESAEREGVRPEPGIQWREHRLLSRRLREEDRRAAAAFEPTLVHAVNCRAPTAAAAADYAEATRAPIFVHFEDNEWSVWGGLPGESAYHRFGQLVRRLASPVHPAGWPHANWLSRRWVSHALALDALTPPLAAEVERRFARPCATLLPVSPRLQSPTDFELPGGLAGMPLALVTGTIYPFSLDDTLHGLRAVAEVQRRGHRLGYLHPGNVHPRIDPAGLALEAGLKPGTFSFPGLLPLGTVEALLMHGDVLLQPGGPSEFNRLRLPSKLQAYLASGTPTITFATGFGELLADREEVLKTRTDSPAELADRIIEVLVDRDLRETLSKGGPTAARRLFDPERNTEQLISHYQDHLASRTRRPVLSASGSL